VQLVTIAPDTRATKTNPFKPKAGGQAGHADCAAGAETRTETRAAASRP
jgi:hypothetical protein